MNRIIGTIPNRNLDFSQLTLILFMLQVRTFSLISTKVIVTTIFGLWSFCHIYTDSPSPNSPPKFSQIPSKFMPQKRTTLALNWLVAKLPDGKITISPRTSVVFFSCWIINFVFRFADKIILTKWEWSARTTKRFSKWPVETQTAKR